jgi:hypothetical protein
MFPATIKDADDVTIRLEGVTQDGPSKLGIEGFIDRVTGDVEVTTWIHNMNDLSTYYQLKCIPTRRMF